MESWINRLLPSRQFGYVLNKVTVHVATFQFTLSLVAYKMYRLCITQLHCTNNIGRYHGPRGGETQASRRKNFGILLLKTTICCRHVCVEINVTVFRQCLVELACKPFQHEMEYKEMIWQKAASCKSVLPIVYRCSKLQICRILKMEE